MNKTKCKMTINGENFQVDSDEPFMDEIMTKYKQHLNI